MKLAFLMVGLLAISLVSASFSAQDFSKTPKTPFSDVKSVSEPSPSSNPTSNDQPKPTVHKSHSSLKTIWVFNGEECVKSDVLSQPFTIGTNSRYLYPYVERETLPNGRRVIQRVFPGEKAVPLNLLTLKYQKEPDCVESVVFTEPLNWDWLHKVKFRK